VNPLKVEVTDFCLKDGLIIRIVGSIRSTVQNGCLSSIEGVDYIKMKILRQEEKPCAYLI